jgi:hypothetical protein
MTAHKLITDLFTGPDGETWAIGRLYSLPMLIAGLALPVVMIWRGQAMDPMAALAGYGALGGGLWALIGGTNSAEPPPPLPPAPGEG